MKKILLLSLILAFCIGLIACSSSDTADNGQYTIDPTEDKISFASTGFDVTGSESDDGNVEDEYIKEVAFRALNETDETFSLVNIKVIAYDKDMNFLEVSGDNETIELAPGEKSKKFKYSLGDGAEYIKLVGYEYIQNDEHFFDTFAQATLYKGSDAICDMNYYSEEDILNETYKENQNKKKRILKDITGSK